MPAAPFTTQTPDMTGGRKFWSCGDELAGVRFF